MPYLLAAAWRVADRSTPSIVVAAALLQVSFSRLLRQVGTTDGLF